LSRDNVATHSLKLDVAICGLLEAVNSVAHIPDPATGIVTVPDEFVTPGFWVLLAAYAWQKHISLDQIRVHPKHKEYLSAIGFARAFGEQDDYPYDRKNKGINYSTLEHLDRPEATERATSAINGCIRNFVGGELPSAFVELLCEVVGDMHDNVWSHGKASGFSLAQKWRASWNPLSRGYCLEFGLADAGIGFLREVQNAGLGIRTDREAIDWCIKEGHSTKKLRPASEWAQRIPPDATGNPLLGIERTRTSENHHLGLGLYKLVRLVREFRGFLWLATGSATLILAPDRKPAYSNLSCPWQGVAIACRFRSDDIAVVREDIESGDKDVEEIMRILGGARD
jgi:hypothetical protein